MVFEDPGQRHIAVYQQHVFMKFIVYSYHPLLCTVSLVGLRQNFPADKDSESREQSREEKRSFSSEDLPRRILSYPKTVKAEGEKTFSL